MLALYAVGLAVSQRASAQLLVDPFEVTMITAGSNRVSASFSLANTSDNPVQATITRQDWDRLENGDNAAALSKECWDIFFIEEVPQRTTAKGNSLRYIFRTGVKVYVAPPPCARWRGRKHGGRGCAGHPSRFFDDSGEIERELRGSDQAADLDFAVRDGHRRYATL